MRLSINATNLLDCNLQREGVGLVQILDLGLVLLPQVALKGGEGRGKPALGTRIHPPPPPSPCEQHSHIVSTAHTRHYM
jgi:hypothetical protein